MTVNKVLFFILCVGLGLNLVVRGDQEAENNLDLSTRPPAINELGAHKTVALGLVYNGNTHPQFREGVKMAVAEVNARGGLLGKPLGLIEMDEAALDPEERDRNVVARQLVENSALLAVIGHSTRANAAQAAILYDANSIIYLNALVAHKTLSNLPLDYTFAIIPDSRDIGEGIADALSQLGLRSVAIVRDPSDLSGEIAIAATNRAAFRKIDIALQVTLHRQQASYQDLLTRLGQADVDALVLLANRQMREGLLQDAARLRYDRPILLGHPEEFGLTAKDRFSEDLIILKPSLFAEQENAYQVADFRRAFLRSYGVTPNGWAGQGYDAVLLLAAAVDAAQSLDPSVVAPALRNNLPWAGITVGYPHISPQPTDYSEALIFVPGNTLASDIFISSNR